MLGPHDVALVEKAACVLEHCGYNIIECRCSTATTHRWFVPMPYLQPGFGHHDCVATHPCSRRARRLASIVGEDVELAEASATSRPSWIRRSGRGLHRLRNREAQGGAHTRRTSASRSHGTARRCRGRPRVRRPRRRSACQRVAGRFQGEGREDCVRALNGAVARAHACLLARRVTTGVNHYLERGPAHVPIGSNGVSTHS